MAGAGAVFQTLSSGFLIHANSLVLHLTLLFRSCITKILDLYLFTNSLPNPINQNAGRHTLSNSFPNPSNQNTVAISARSGSGNGAFEQIEHSQKWKCSEREKIFITQNPGQK